MSTIKIKIEGEIDVTDLIQEIGKAAVDDVYTYGKARRFSETDGKRLVDYGNFILRNLEGSNVKSESTEEILPK